MADNWCSHGLGLPRQLTGRQPRAGLPMDERLFQKLCATAGSSLSADPTEGLWAYKIKLVNILGPIHDLNRRLVEEHLDDETINATVDSLTRRLDAWADALPAHMQMNDKTLESFIQDGYGGPFVALHLGYHHYATLLYFQYLDSQKPKSASTEVNVEKCKRHASMYSKLLARSRSKSGCEVVYATVGQMTVVSSSVLLHTLLLGTSDEVADVRQDLTANFAALIELRELWPGLDRIQLGLEYAPHRQLDDEVSLGAFNAAGVATEIKYSVIIVHTQFAIADKRHPTPTEHSGSYRRQQRHDFPSHDYANLEHGIVPGAFEHGLDYQLRNQSMSGTTAYQ
ncbi:hypothetical protein NU219Hw_g5573t1 [Hortaea werneckii]